MVLNDTRIQMADDGLFEAILATLIPSLSVGTLVPPD